MADELMSSKEEAFRKVFKFCLHVYVYIYIYGEVM